jgi:protein TonB
VLAAAVTLGMYAFLPFLERLSANPPKKVRIREARTAAFLPPPPSRVRTSRRENRERDPEPPRPRMLRVKRKLTPLQIAMDLNMALGEVGGDFSVDFGVSRPVLAEQVQELIYEIADLDEPPRPLARLKPIYPPHARMRKIEGRVILEFVVDADGTARGIEVISSSPGDIFTRAAIRAVERWRFSPGIKSGRPVSVRVRQKVTFELD